MIAYQSRTGTRRNLDAMRAAGFRLLVSATGVQRTEGMRYALDNGAWTAHQQGRPFDAGLFRACLQRLGSCADWVVVPDIVAGGLKSLHMSEAWLPEVLSLAPRALIAVQDGLTQKDVAPLLSPRVGLAIGGSGPWKECALAHRAFAAPYLHALRVNTRRRLDLARWAGCDSFDGTSGTRFAKTIPQLDAWRRQEGLWAAQ